MDDLVDHLFDDTRGCVITVAQSQQGGLTNGLVDVTQGDSGKVAGEGPTTTMSLHGVDPSRLSQARQRPTYNNRVGLQKGPHLLRGHRSLVVRQMQQEMKDQGKAAVSIHVTYTIT